MSGHGPTYIAVKLENCLMRRAGALWHLGGGIRVLSVEAETAESEAAGILL